MTIYGLKKLFKRVRFRSWSLFSRNRSNFSDKYQYRYRNPRKVIMMCKNICVVKELMMKEIPNQELKLNLRSSVTIMFNLIEIKTVSIFFFRVLNIYNCSNNQTGCMHPQERQNRPSNCLSKFRSSKMATLILALFLYKNICVLF